VSTGTRLIRPSTTRSTLALWAKSLFNALLFFALILALLPWLAHRALPAPLPFHGVVSRALGVVLFVGGIVVWLWCLDVFSRQGRGTPFPLDAPSQLVTQGPYGVIRNPIMVAEVGIAWAEALYFGSLGVLLYAALLTVVAIWSSSRSRSPNCAVASARRTTTTARAYRGGGRARGNAPNAERSAGRHAWRDRLTVPATEFQPR